MYLSTFERGFVDYKLGLLRCPFNPLASLARHQAWWAGWNLAKAAAAIHRLDWVPE